MKLIKYQLCTEINHGTEDEPQIEQSLAAVTLGWSEANEELAKKKLIAVNTPLKKNQILDLLKLFNKKNY